LEPFATDIGRAHHFTSWKYSNCELPRTPLRRSSQKAQKAKFAEFLF
jgi:hypothetical protein